MRAKSLQRWRPSAAEWNRSAAAHFLGRAGFGHTARELDRAVSEGFEATCERFLDGAEDASNAHDERVRDSVRHLLPLNDLEALQAWWAELILHGAAPLRERTTLLWHGHFATSHDKVDDVRLMHRQNELFRNRGLGDFRELLHAVAQDPAMLLWLDGNSNVVTSPNENFAREVMELFALGIGNYTEHDVAEAARAFTGWGAERRAFVERSEQHDGGSKRIFGKSGNFTGKEAIDLVLAHPACPLHIARRLLSEFVHPKPDPVWVQETADALVEEDWDIGRTLARLLRSRIFFAPECRGSRIAGPIELLVRAARGIEARPSGSWIAQRGTRMGQALFRPPNVAGWKGGRAWIHAGAWLERHNALTDLATGAHPGRRARLDREVSVDELWSNLMPTMPDGVSAAFERTLADTRAPREPKHLAALLLTSPEFQLV